jgi:hypothetical protein
MIELILMLALIGFLVYLITTYIPMPDIFQKAIIVIAIVLVILYLIRLFGVDLPLPQRR